MKNKYLPSKNFITKIIKIIILVIVVFFFYKIGVYFNNRITKNSHTPLNVVKIVQTDSNNNGIPDWEERLWGLNPKSNGKANKAFILAKRKALNSGTNFTNEDETLTKNETLSREFFAVIMSLKQTGKLNSESMKAIADSISQKIEAKPIPDIYTNASLTETIPSLKANGVYFSGFATLVEKYKNDDIGSELSLIVQGLAYKNKQIISLIKPIATSYKNFGQDLVKIPVPTNIAPIDLSIANDYEKIGQTIDGLAQLQNDPLIGMQSLINYKKYTDDLFSNIDKLSNALKI